MARRRKIQSLALQIEGDLKVRLLAALLLRGATRRRRKRLETHQVQNLPNLIKPNYLHLLSHGVIAETLNLNYHVVQHLCRKALLKQQPISPEKQVRVLEQVHIDYLLSQRTLEMYSGLTMKQRTIRFHRVYTNKRIAVTTLRRLYLKNGIKRKKIRQEKPKPNLMRPNHL